MNVLYSLNAGQFSDHSESMFMTSSRWGSKALCYFELFFYTHLHLTPLWNETRQYVTTVCQNCMHGLSCQNNGLFAGWDNVQHAISNGFARGSITKFWFECDQNSLIQNVFLAKTVKDIGNHYSLQQDGYSVIWLEVKVILPRNFVWLKRSRRLNPNQFFAWLANLKSFLLIQCCLKIQQQRTTDGSTMCRGDCNVYNRLALI